MAAESQAQKCRDRHGEKETFSRVGRKDETVSPKLFSEPEWPGGGRV